MSHTAAVCLIVYVLIVLIFIGSLDNDEARDDLGISSAGVWLLALSWPVCMTIAIISRTARRGW